jgi:hypothetical protein
MCRSALKFSGTATSFRLMVLRFMVLNRFMVLDGQ